MSVFFEPKIDARSNIFVNTLKKLEQGKNRSRILWAKLKEGDVSALGDLYDIYADELFAYGLQFTADKSQVLDAIHDLYVNLYKYRENLAATDNVAYYLFRALKNNILTTEKKSRNLVGSNFANDFICSDGSVEERICEVEFENERAYKLAKAITTLSKKQRKALFLRFTEERSYEDIAAIMKVSIPTSRTLIYRAVKTLRKQLYVGSPIL